MDPPSPPVHRVAHIQPRLLNPSYTEPGRDWGDQGRDGHQDTRGEQGKDTLRVSKCDEGQDSLRVSRIDQETETSRGHLSPSPNRLSSSRLTSSSLSSGRRSPRRSHTPPRSLFLPVRRDSATSELPASPIESSYPRVTSSMSLNLSPRSIQPARSLLRKVVQIQDQSKDDDEVFDSQVKGQQVGKVIGLQGQGQEVSKGTERSINVVPPSENNKKRETSPAPTPPVITISRDDAPRTNTDVTSSGISTTSASTGVGGYSEGNGHIPASTNQSISSNGLPIHRHLRSPGLSPGSNGLSPTRDDTTFTSNGTATTDNGMTTTGNGTSTATIAPITNGTTSSGTGDTGTGSTVVSTTANTSGTTTPNTSGTTTVNTSRTTTATTTGTKSGTTTASTGSSTLGKKKLALLSKKKGAWLKAIKSAKGDRQLNQVTRQSDVEEVIFNLLAEQNHVSMSKFWNVIKWAGLWQRDPRLKECRQQMMEKSRSAAMEALGAQSQADVILDKDTFKKCISDNIWMISRSFKKDLIIPEFRGFTQELERIFLRCKENDSGEMPDSVSMLSGVDRDLWGVSVCTIDGQRAAFGDSTVPFCMESCAMPFNYALAVTELGAEEVHKWVGFEPSGTGSGDLSLNHDRKPFNPLLNSGAIVILSMLRAGQCPADRFDYLFRSFKKLAGNEYIGFNNAVYLSEKDNSDRNYAICYNLQENGCTPGTPLLDTLDFHFQMGSVEVTAESGAVMAATLANGGICPITCRRVLTTDAVRDTLSLMHCCGMYDYSGHFAFTVGLPAKSGIGGGIMLVIPHVMGICCYSPLIDNHGNSVRGLQFCQELVQAYTFHNYDCMGGSTTKTDPCAADQESSVTSVVKLLYGASVGDVATIRRFALSGMDMSSTNYDGRTALHVAAAHGHFHIVKMLIERCGVIHDIKDRYGKTPLDAARRFGRTAIVEYLLEEHDRQKPTSLFDVLAKAMQSAKTAASMPALVPSPPRTPVVKSPQVKSIIVEEGLV